MENLAAYFLQKEIDDVWHNEQTTEFRRLVKHFEVHGVFDSRQRDQNSETLRKDFSQESEAAIKLSLKIVGGESSFNASQIEKLKLTNTIFKLLDRLPEKHHLRDNWLEQNRVTAEKLVIDIHKNLSDHATHLPKQPTKKEFNKPLIFLFSDGPICSAYLDVIDALGIHLDRVVRVVPKRDLHTKKLIMKWLPNKVKIPLARYTHDFRMQHWRKQLIRNYEAEVRRILVDVANIIGLNEETSLVKPSTPSLKAITTRIDDLFVDGFNDLVLLKYFDSMPASTILFSGGGILPKSIFKQNRHDFIHFHPGFIPDFRGADCYLWSSLITKQTAVTSFIMNHEIDGGTVINRIKNHSPVLPEDPNIPTSDWYRMLFAFIDPLFRANALQNFIETTYDSGPQSVYTQQLDTGNTFHFMHAELIEMTRKFGQTA